jgi:uncharacterized protein involved in type VI secretion and phage assembly
MNDAHETTLPEVEIRIAVGDEEWRVRHFLLEETLGAPYHAAVRLISEHDDVDVTAPELLGKDALVFIQRGEDERIVPGVVRRVELLGAASGKQHVGVVVVPVLALLDQRRRSRVFQNAQAVSPPVTTCTASSIPGTTRAPWPLQSSLPST